MFSQLGLIAFTSGAMLWIIDVSLRLSVDPRAAQETVRTGTMPEYYVPLTLWTQALFVIFTILAFSAVAAYGAAALSSRVLPRWLGWTAMVYALAGLGLFAYAHDFPPFTHYLLLIVVGGMLFVRRNQLPTGQQK